MYKMCDIIRLGLSTIFEKLRNLARDVKMLEENSEMRVQRWLCMERRFMEKYWEKDRGIFLQALNNYVQEHSNVLDLKDYIDKGNEQFLDRIETLKQALDSMQP